MTANELCLTEIQSSCVLPSFNSIPQAQEEEDAVASQDSGIDSATSLIEDDPDMINDEALNQQFLGDVKGMADRIIDMRHKLRAGIEVRKNI